MSSPATAAASGPAASSASRGTLLVTASDLAPQALALLTGFEIVFAGKTPTPDDIRALCQRHDPVAIIVRYGRIEADAIAAAPSLKVIAKHGSGTDTIDKIAAAARGIAVLAAAGANAVAVAEHAIAMLLACAKGLVPLHARMTAGHWDKSTHKSLELGGRTLGLIGLGAIGRHVAVIGRALQMRVIGHDPYAGSLPDGVEVATLEQIWRQADAISLHCPLTDENRGFIDAAVLARCRPGVILLNTARGGLIDEAALLAAVRSGHVGAAALDSFAVEPMTAGHPFQGVPGFLLTPHIGGVSQEAYVRMGVAAARNVLSVVDR